MSDVEAELAKIHARLAALASRPPDPSVAQELGAIRAQLRDLARSNEQVAERLRSLLGDDEDPSRRSPG